MEVSHESEFSLCAGFPAEVERGKKVAELFTVEDHSIEDVVHEGLQGSDIESVFVGDGSKFFSVFLCLESIVAFSNCGFAQTFAFLEGAYVFSNVVTFVDKLCIGADQAD